ncbi:MAG: hypothetical protein SFW67_25970 [Myxococcaceae bacterium]|nr:hypothetical protein [Myxococcaceae bacterium]
MHGINPKRWFYDLGRHLRSDPGDRIVLTGAACEQWFNGLLFRVIAEGLPSRLTAYPEWKRRQHDVAVLPVAQHEGRAVVDWKCPVSIIENKVLYLSYSTGKRDALIARLLQQVQAPSTARDRIGLLLAAYVYRPAEGVPHQTFAQFRRDVGARFRAAIREAPALWKVTIDHGGPMETVLKESDTKVGGEKVVVACAGQYVRLRQK